VKKSCTGNHCDLLAGYPHSAANHDGKSSGAFGVTSGLCIFEGKGVAQMLRSDVIGAFQIRHRSVKFVSAGLN